MNPSSSVPDKPMGTYYVLFDLEQRAYAFSLEQVERALRIVSITEVPESPPWLAGVINRAGEILPVIDLRERFERAESRVRLSDRLLVLAAGERKAALSVDRVTDVVERAESEVQVIDALETGSRPVRAAFEHDQQLVLVLDAEQLISAVDHEKLDGLMDMEAAFPMLTTDTVNPDDWDLTTIKGIGRVYADRLKNIDINSFNDLANADAHGLLVKMQFSSKRIEMVHGWIHQAAEKLRSTVSVT